MCWRVFSGKKYAQKGIHMKKTVVGQDELIADVTKVFDIFKNSESAIRPHFILTGPSGSGKTHTIHTLAKRCEFDFMEINAAQLTKEGTAGNSLSKALTPLLQKSGTQTIVFVDEFDKLFISGNHNSDLAHEVTNGVQNEFLKVLESDEACVYGDYGKYLMASTKNVLFIFAGAFNGEEDVSLDRLRDFGVKTEFLGRVGLVYNAIPLTLEDLLEILKGSMLLKTYLDLFDGVKRTDVIKTIGDHLEENYRTNPIGARAINTLIHQYFIKGGKLETKVSEKATFQHKMPL